MLKIWILALHVCIVVANCPRGFNVHHSWCYSVIRVEATWAEANIFCHAFGSQLAIVESQNEFDFLKELVNRIGGSWDTPKFWLGGSDLLSEGQWEWSETRKPLTFKAWDGDNPDNGDDGEENCMLMDKGRSYRWNDDNCSRKRYFVCERPVDLISQIPSELLG